MRAAAKAKKALILVFDDTRFYMHLLNKLSEQLVAGFSIRPALFKTEDMDYYSKSNLVYIVIDPKLFDINAEMVAEIKTLKQKGTAVAFLILSGQCDGGCLPKINDLISDNIARIMDLGSQLGIQSIAVDNITTLAGSIAHQFTEQGGLHKQVVPPYVTFIKESLASQLHDYYFAEDGIEKACQWFSALPDDNKPVDFAMMFASYPASFGFEFQPKNNRKLLAEVKNLLQPLLSAYRQLHLAITNANRVEIEHALSLFCEHIKTAQGSVADSVGDLSQIRVIRSLQDQAEGIIKAYKAQASKGLQEDIVFLDEASSMPTAPSYEAIEVMRRREMDEHGGKQSGPMPDCPAPSAPASAAAAKVPEIEPDRYPNAPDDYKCPIGCELMLDPVLAEDEFSYEREKIKQWIDRRKDSGEQLTSPMTGKAMSDTLLANKTLKNAITAWKDRQDLIEASRAGVSSEPKVQPVALKETQENPEQTVYLKALSFEWAQIYKKGY